MQWIPRIVTIFPSLISSAMRAARHSASAISGGRDVNLTADNNEAALFLPILLYLFVPSAVVLFYFSKWPILVIGAAGLGSVFLFGESKLRKWPLRDLFFNTWPYLLLAAGIVWLSGVLPPFAENADWRKHYAIFNALTSKSWPPKFITDDGVSVLRYSLGYYVVPALAAKLLGTWILSTAIFIWSTLGCYFALVLAFGTASRRKMQCLLMGLIFLLFSGADIVGTYLTGAFPNPSSPFMHFEWWGSFGVLPSAVTSIFWTPQHVIPGWIASLLFIRYPREAVRNCGLIICAASIWSPFIAIGIIPTLVWAVLVTGFRELLTALNLMVAPVLLGLSFIFLTSGAGSIPFSLVWNGNGFSISVWILFVLLEFIFIAMALFLINPKTKAILLIHGGFLLLLCFFKGGVVNDLLMRASIPSLGIFALLTANGFVLGKNDVRKLPLLILFMAGLVTPLCEVWRGFISTRMKNADSISILNIVDDNRELKSQYLIPLDREIGLLPPVVSEKSLKFSPFGDAEFDFKLNRVGTDVYADAAMVSQKIILPVGNYKLDATLDWDVTAKVAGSNGAHISIHSVKMLVPIFTSRENNKLVSSYFYSDGKPLQISFGLGGWGMGKGFIELKKLEISPLKESD